MLSEIIKAKREIEMIFYPLMYCCHIYVLDSATLIINISSKKIWKNMFEEVLKSTLLLDPAVALLGIQSWHFSIWLMFQFVICFSGYAILILLSSSSSAPVFEMFFGEWKKL